MKFSFMNILYIMGYLKGEVRRGSTLDLDRTFVGIGNLFETTLLGIQVMCIVGKQVILIH